MGALKVAGVGASLGVEEAEEGEGEGEEVGVVLP